SAGKSAKPARAVAVPSQVGIFSRNHLSYDELLNLSPEPKNAAQNHEAKPRRGRSQPGVPRAILSRSGDPPVGGLPASGRRGPPRAPRRGPFRISVDRPRGARPRLRSVRAGARAASFQAFACGGVFL